MRRKLVLTALFLTATLGLAAAELGYEIDDFEDGDRTAEPGLGWVVIADDQMGGGSHARLALLASGAGGSRGALEVAGTVKEGFPRPFSGTWTSLTPDGLTGDFTRYQGIRFSARGDGGTYHVGVRCGDRSAQGNFMADFTPAATWSRFEIPFTALQQVNPNPESPLSWTGRDLSWIGFNTRPGWVGEFRFVVDDIELY